MGGRQEGATLPGQALGTENKVLCLILPVTLKDRCHYYFIFAGEEGGSERLSGVAKVAQLVCVTSGIHTQECLTDSMEVPEGTPGSQIFL